MNRLENNRLVSKMFGHPAIIKLDPNHPRVRQARRAPMESHILELQQTQNAGHKDLFYPRTLSFPQLQQRYGELLHGNPIKDGVEKLPMGQRNRLINLSHTKNTAMPTFTHGSGWFEEGIKSSQEVYGKNRFIIRPDKHASVRQ